MKCLKANCLYACLPSQPVVNWRVQSNHERYKLDSIYFLRFITLSYFSIFCAANSYTFYFNPSSYSPFKKSKHSLMCTFICISKARLVYGTHYAITLLLLFFLLLFFLLQFLHSLLFPFLLLTSSFFRRRFFVFAFLFVLVFLFGLRVLHK